MLSTQRLCNTYLKIGSSEHLRLQAWPRRDMLRFACVDEERLWVLCRQLHQRGLVRWVQRLRFVSSEAAHYRSVWAQARASSAMHSAKRALCAGGARTLYPMGIASVSWVVGSLEPVERHVERRVVGELARGWVESESVPTVILDIHNRLIENLREFWLAK